MLLCFFTLVFSLPASINSQSREEVGLWQTVQNSTNPDDLRAYLDKYPEGTFAPLAKRRLATLVEAAERAAAAGRRAAAEAEDQRFNIAVWHQHALAASACGGILKIGATSVTYEGDEHNVVLLKAQVTRIDPIPETGLIFRSPERNWTFHWDFGKYKKPANMAKLLIEKWGFVWDKDGKRLIPPPR